MEGEDGRDEESRGKGGERRGREKERLRDAVFLHLHGPRKRDVELLPCSLSGVAMETECWPLHD